MSYRDDGLAVRVKEVSLDRSTISVTFEDGFQGTADVHQLGPAGTQLLFWSRMTYSPTAIIVPTDAGTTVYIPWTTVRVVLDPEYAIKRVIDAEVQAHAIGRRFAFLRSIRGLSGTEVARRAQSTQVTISRFENGHTDVTITLMARLLAAMGYSFTDLFPPDTEQGGSR